MRTFLFFAVLFAMFIFAIVAGYKPSLIEEQYNKIKEPIATHFAEKREAAWREAKDKEWLAWEKKISLPSDCVNPRSSIREMECKGLLQNKTNTFERIWADKVASGWKPDGVD